MPKNTIPPDHKRHLENPVLSPHKDVAIFFAVTGILICGYLLVVMCLMASWSGWGDGATANAIKHPIRIAFLYSSPVLIFFITSIIASLSSSRTCRVILAVIALISFIIVSVGVIMSVYNEPTFLLYYVISSLPFIGGWIFILENQNAEQDVASNP